MSINSESESMNNISVYRQDLIDWFVKGLFFNKNVSDNYKGEKFRMSSTDKSDVLLAVKKAYVDMSPRTIDRLGNAHKIKNFDDDFNNIFSKLADSFVNYFEDPPIKNENEFDKWHNDVCDSFENKFNKLLDNYKIKDKNGNITKISYGKAQKIVNMTFKYIYCFDDRKDFDYFKYCHMTLDSYTLNWFLEDVRNWLKENNNFKFAKNKIPSWSNLDKGKDCKEEFSYLWIQTQIRNYLKEQSKYSKYPFIAEFVIWQEEKANTVNREDK